MRPDSELTRVVLVTGHIFGLRAFEGIISSTEYLQGQIELGLVVGLAEKFRASTVGYGSPEDLATEEDVPFVSVEDGTLAAVFDRIAAHRPHYILVIGWSRLVRSEVLSIPTEKTSEHIRHPGTYGCIGMHPTNLPVGRGQAPIPWTIVKGLKSTALSVFFLEEGADTGPIIAQHAVTVDARETAASLFYRMANLHYAAGRELAGGLATRRIESHVQDPSKASRWQKRRPTDGEIVNTMTYAQIDALVRALTGPYPRAFVEVEGVRYEIQSVAPRSNIDFFARVYRPQVFADRVEITCADAVVVLFRRRHLTSAEAE